MKDMKGIMVLIVVFITLFFIYWFIILKFNQAIDKRDENIDTHAKMEYNSGYIDGLYDMTKFINSDTNLSNNEKIILLEFIVNQSENKIESNER